MSKTSKEGSCACVDLSHWVFSNHHCLCLLHCCSCLGSYFLVSMRCWGLGFSLRSGNALMSNAFLSMAEYLSRMSSSFFLSWDARKHSKSQVPLGLHITHVPHRSLYPKISVDFVSGTSCLSSVAPKQGDFSTTEYYPEDSGH